MRRSPQDISTGALFLAAKVEECPRKVRDVLNVFTHLEQKRAGAPPTPLDVYSNAYTTRKDRLIRAEREILKELGFILYTVRTPEICAPRTVARPRALLRPWCLPLVTADTVGGWYRGSQEHPHKFILNYVKLLQVDETQMKKLAQHAWNFINDSQRT